MATRAQHIEQDDESPAVDVSDLIKRVEDNPALVLTNEKAFEAYYSHVEQQAFAVKADLSTAAGRDRIRSTASEIARKKTTFDKTRKDLTEDYRRKTATINAVGKLVVDRFAALQARVRQPLTEWEEAEDARKAEADRLLEYFRSASIVSVDETAADVEARLNEVRSININDEILGPRTGMATDLRDDAVKALREALERIKKAEAERAELERLRRAEAERQEREAQERREREVKEAEEARQKAEQKRIERERHEAAYRARREAEEASERARTEELARIEREKQEAIDAANERARKAEEEAASERDRIAREQAARDETERREAAEKARREADQQHRSAVRTAVKKAIMSCGADEETSKKIVLAIQAGEVPHVRIEF